jgi:hypothetical protein
MSIIKLQCFDLITNSVSKYYRLQNIHLSLDFSKIYKYLDFWIYYYSDIVILHVVTSYQQSVKFICNKIYNWENQY